MARKRWTPREEITEDLLKFREKRKWQLALRRYVIQRNVSQEYAPYFSIDIEGFRNWIEIQFTEGVHWDSFGKTWQFEHVIPVTYFNFSEEEELKLCWHFINIRVEAFNHKMAENQVPGIFSAKSYFTYLYNQTGIDQCNKMIRKIEQLESVGAMINSELTNFLLNNNKRLEALATLTVEELKRINQGETLENVLIERDLLRKFG